MDTVLRIRILPAVSNVPLEVIQIPLQTGFVESVLGEAILMRVLPRARLIQPASIQSQAQQIRPQMILAIILLQVLAIKLSAQQDIVVQTPLCPLFNARQVSFLPQVL